MELKKFNIETYVEPERVGRPSQILPVLQLAIADKEIFSIPVYTSKKNRVEGKEQVQSSRIISIMRDIASAWSYAYHQGETLELILIPPRTKVTFVTKKLVSK